LVQKGFGQNAGFKKGSANNLSEVNIHIRRSLFKEDYVEKAISFLKKNVKGQVLVAFSGGKDSIVMYEIVKRSKIPFRLSHSITTIDPPEVLRFIKENYPECEFCKSKHSFWKMTLMSNPPLLGKRWCCTALKKKPSWKYPEKERILGIRREESSRRNNYPEINYFEKLGHTHYYPIIDWKEWQVWEFIEKNNLPYLSLYDDENFSRSGCIICPFNSFKINQINKEKWPGYYKIWEKIVYKWYLKRVEQGRTMVYPSAETFLQAWYNQEATKWYEKDQKERSLFGDLDLKKESRDA